MSNFLIDDLMKSNPAAKAVSIALPTNGEFYNVGEVLSLDADPMELEILPVSLLEENMFNDPFLILSGKATTKLINKVAPDVSDPAKLAEVDIETILLASRLASHGEKMKITHICQNQQLKDGIVLKENETPSEEHLKCNHKTDLTINLLQDVLIKYRPFKDVIGLLDSLYFELPGANQKVHIKPIAYEDSLYLFKKLYTTYEVGKNENFDIFDDASVEKYANKFIEMQGLAAEAILSYVWFVESSTGEKTSDFDIINAWYAKLNKEQIDVIQENINKLKKYVEDLAKISYKCESCGFDNSFRLEFDPQKLFTKAEDTKTPTVSFAPLKKITKSEKTSSRILQR